MDPGGYPRSTMASTHDRIDEHMRRWVAKQPMFFVATAPVDSDGLVNVSPKGPIGTLRVLDDSTVAYLDFYGSGAETIAHLRENGRIVVMLCAFDGPPQIVRFHGTGSVVLPGDERFDALLADAGFEGLTDVEEARRAVVVVDVQRISKSCGYGVPLMEHVGEREHFDLSKKKRLRVMGPEEFSTFQVERNARSVDGLPALEA
jgi:predicted pyridoxine 5'-phosphate oxidase superfamily flavin-nucleotide-binding protein